MSELRQSINQISQHKKVPAIIIDVVGNKCSVQLSNSGRRLYGIAFSGGTASNGASVLVDYASGVPVAMIPGEVSAVQPTQNQIKARAVTADLPVTQLTGDGSGSSVGRIQRYASTPGAPEEYDFSDTGLDAASADASAGDTILIPPGTLSSDHTLTASVHYRGAGIDATIFSGELTAANGNLISEMSIIRSDTSPSPVVGITIPAGTVSVEIYQVLIDVHNAGAAFCDAYAIDDYATGGTLSIARSALEATTNASTSYCINRADTSRAINIYYSIMNGETADFSDTTTVGYYPVVDTNSSSIFGGGANYSEFETDGTLEFHGNATVWEDLRFPATIGKPGASTPGWAQFKDNGPGSVGVFTYVFDKNTDEELFFIAQFPHSWDNSSIEPHIHWAPTDTDTGSVVWGMEYTWVDVEGTYGNTTIITVTDAADGTAYKHQYADFATVSAAGITGISSIMLIRIYRDANNAADTYDADAALLEFDIHYRINTIGSRTEMAK